MKEIDLYKLDDISLLNSEAQFYCDFFGVYVNLEHDDEKVQKEFELKFRSLSQLDIFLGAVYKSVGYPKVSFV